MPALKRCHYIKVIISLFYLMVYGDVSVDFSLVADMM